MIIGLIGLGKMGNAIAQRLVDAGYEVIGFDFSHEACKAAKNVGVTIAKSIADLAKDVHIFWLMVPAGSPVDSVIDEILPQLGSGDIVIDGGNSKFTDSIRRGKLLAQKNVFFLDCGTSGGVHGRESGFSLMIGGDESAFIKLREMFEAVAAPGGVGHVGSSGAGHYVKMVHNGIEYGLMEAYAEGLHLIKDGSFAKESVDLEEVTRIWLHGSIIRSWLLELTHGILAQDQELHDVSGEVAESGMGKWTVEDGKQHDVPLPVIEESLKVRARSREDGGNYATKLVALMRNAFGGHAFKKTKK